MTCLRNAITFRLDYVIGGVKNAVVEEACSYRLDEGVYVVAVAS